MHFVKTEGLGSWVSIDSPTNSLGRQEGQKCVGRRVLGLANILKRTESVCRRVVQVIVEIGTISERVNSRMVRLHGFSVTALASFEQSNGMSGRELV
jgi:hypothetical protein